MEDGRPSNTLVYFFAVLFFWTSGSFCNVVMIM
uniref:Uncharacterized protein n=1 Tax=Arundo donax TaxID=35708 RepID=A0A0A9BFR9_ARUDO